MPSRAPGDQPDPAAELLGRWQAHHEGRPDPARGDRRPEEHRAGSDDPPRLGPVPVEADQHEADEADEAADEADADDADDAGETPSDPVPPSHTTPARHSASRSAAERRHLSVAPTYDQTEAGREVIEALGMARAVEESEPKPEPERPSPTSRTPTRRAPARPASPAPTPAPLPSTPGRSTDVEFEPRLFVRRVLAVLVLVLVPVTGVAGYLAYQVPDTLRLGVAGTLLVVTLVLYAVRVGSATTHLAIRGGQLEVVRGSSREIFDLTSRFTRIEVVGRPGRPGWKVLMARFGRDPLVIDASMVDPAAFSAALEQHRPGSF